MNHPVAPSPLPAPATERTGAPPSGTTEDESPGPRQWAGLWVLALALAMIVLDGTIVGVALPTIIRQLDLTLTSAQWVNSLYSVVFAALLLTFGRLGDRFGRRRLLLAGVAIFVGGSILAALSGNDALLITARAVQGVGGALILPSTLSTVNATFRGKDRAAAFGIWGAVMSGAAALGPLLGGWLTKVADWPWIFWVNVPIGVLVIIAAIFVVDETTGDAEERGFDIGGLVLSAVGFGLVVFGLIEGTSLGWWKPKAALAIGPFAWPAEAAVSAVPVALAVGAVAIAVFVALQTARTRRQVTRLLEVSLFQLPTFAWGNLTAALVAVGEFALVFVLPLYLTMSLGLNALQAGVVLASMALGAFVAGASARHLAALVSAPVVVVIGLTLEVLGAAGTAMVVAAGAHEWLVALTLLPYGIGLGLASAQLTSTVLRDVPVALSGTGSAVQSTARQLGSALGSALGGTALAVALGDKAIQSVDPSTLGTASAQAVWAAVVVLCLGLAGSLVVAKVSRTGAARPE